MSSWTCDSLIKVIKAKWKCMSNAESILSKAPLYFCFVVKSFTWTVVLTAEFEDQPVIC